MATEWLESLTCDQQVAGSNPGRRAAECNPGQVVYTRVPLSPSSIIWYRPQRAPPRADGDIFPENWIARDEVANNTCHDVINNLSEFSAVSSWLAVVKLWGNAGERRSASVFGGRRNAIPLAYTTAVGGRGLRWQLYLQHKQQKKCALNAWFKVTPIVNRGNFKSSVL